MKIFTKILITGALIFGLFGILTPPVFATNGIDICSGDGKDSIVIIKLEVKLKLIVL